MKRGEKAKEARRRLGESEAVPSEVRKEMHGRNVQLYVHGICIVGNRLINHILNQVYAKDDPKDIVRQCSSIINDDIL